MLTYPSSLRLHPSRTDHLGTTEAVYNEAKTRTGGIDYTAWGEILTTDGAASGITRRYTGHAWDPLTGDYFAPYRFYSPGSHRWLTRDPLGMVDGPNVYGYVGGNAPSRVDNHGLTWNYSNGGWDQSPGGPGFPAPGTLNPDATPGGWVGMQGCTNADPLSADSGICRIYDECDTFLGYGARCVCEFAGESDWGQLVRGCLACAKKKGIDGDAAHRECYRAADRRIGRLRGLRARLDIGVRLTAPCLWNYY